jgi:hypothetical protein
MIDGGRRRRRSSRGMGEREVENIYCGGIFLLTMENKYLFLKIRDSEIITAVGSLLSC